MKVKVTVYLKSGGNISTVLSGVTMEEAMVPYSDTFKRNVKVITHEQTDGGSVQIIPTDNIACVDLVEVAE